MVPSVNINQRDIRPKYNANERLVISGVVESNLPGVPPNELGRINRSTVAGLRVTGHYLPLDMSVQGFLSHLYQGTSWWCFPAQPRRPVSVPAYWHWSDGDASAEVNIVMNLSPVNGICRARCRTAECTTMREGMAIRDRFTLSALDWEDEDEGPLWYRFGYNDRTGQQFFVTDFTMSESVEAIVPAGADDTVPAFSVYTTCDIRDLYGGTASGTDRITVIPYEVDGSLADAAGSRLSEAASSGDTQQQFWLVDAFAASQRRWQPPSPLPPPDDRGGSCRRRKALATFLSCSV